MVTQPYTTETTFDERMGIAHDAGKRAKGDGWPISKCPFTPGTPAYVEWCNGWEETATTKKEIAA